MTDSTQALGLGDLFAEEEFVRNLARSLVADASAADDIVQQAWVRALEAAPDAVRQPRAWLGTVVRRLARQLHRAEARRTKHERAAARDEALASPLDWIEVEERRRLLIEAVRSLPEPYRKTVLQRYRAGWSLREMAEREQVKLAAIESRLRRAKALLRASCAGESSAGEGERWALALLPLAVGARAGSAGAVSVASQSWGTATIMKKTVVAFGVCLMLLVGVPLWRSVSSEASEPPTAVSEVVASPHAVGVVVADDVEALRQDVGAREAASEMERDPIAAPARVRGRLVDEGGAPLAGVDVALVSWASEEDAAAVRLDRPLGGLGLAREVGATDTAGVFEFVRVPPGTRLALDYSDGGGADAFVAIQQSPIPDETTDLGTIVVRRGPIVTGRIVDDTGQPVAGAVVRGCNGLDSGLTTRLPIHLFDPEGGFMMGYEQPEPKIVTGQAWGAVLDRLRLVFSQTHEPHSRPLARLMLESPGWLDGLVSALPFARTTTGLDGRFSLSGLRVGSAQLLFAAPRVGRTRRRFEVADAGRDLGDIKMRRSVKLKTQLVDADGRPVEGATVCLQTAMRPRVLSAPYPTTAWVTTDAEGIAVGRAQYRQEPDEFITIAARRGAGEPWMVWPTARLPEREVVVWPPAVSLRIRAVDGEDRAPALDALTLVQGPPLGDALTSGIQPAIDLHQRSRREADGGWLIERLVPGFYTVLMRSEGLVPVAIGVQIDAESETPTIRFPREPTHGIALTVVDDQGQPVVGARVRSRPKQGRDWDVTRVRRLLAGTSAPGRSLPISAMTSHRLDALPEGRWSEHGRTDVRGRLEMDGLAAGSAVVTVVHPTAGQAAQEILVPTPQLSVRLVPSARVSGRVLESGRTPTGTRYALTIEPIAASGGGRAVPDANPQRRAQARTTENGRFRFTPLAPGCYRVLLRPEPEQRPSAFAAALAAAYPDYAHSWEDAHPESDEPRVEFVELLPGKLHELTIDVDAGGRQQGVARAVLNGAVRIDGESVQGVEVVASLDDEERRAPTDPGGRYALTGLRPGDWRVQVEQGGERIVLASVSIPASSVRQFEHDFDIRTGRVRAVVAMPGGRPASGAEVTFYSRDGSKRTARAGADGTLALRVAAGRYHAYAKSGRHRGSAEERDIEVGGTTQFTIGLEPTTELRLHLEGAAPHSVGVKHVEGGRTYIVRVDADSRVALLRTARPGTYRVVVRGRGVRALPAEFEVSAQEPQTEVAVRLVPNK